MPDAKIVDRIVAEARARGEELLSEAQEKHDTELGEKLARLQQDVALSRQRDRRRAEEAVQQQLSAKRLEERKKLLGLKRQLLDQAYQQAWDQLTSGDRYKAYLDRQLQQNAQKGDQLVVSGMEADRFQGELKPLMDKHGVTLSAERGHFRGGFIVVRGETRLNCTLDQRFHDLHEDSEIEAAKRLFGTGG
jgi:vacuolar-type H+-ATPase subunit E/Vma4